MLCGGQWEPVTESAVLTAVKQVEMPNEINTLLGHSADNLTDSVNTRDVKDTFLENTGFELV